MAKELFFSFQVIRSLKKISSCYAYFALDAQAPFILQEASMLSAKLMEILSSTCLRGTICSENLLAFQC